MVLIVNKRFNELPRFFRSLEYLAIFRREVGIDSSSHCLLGRAFRGVTPLFQWQERKLGYGKNGCLASNSWNASAKDTGRKARRKPSVPSCTTDANARKKT